MPLPDDVFNHWAGVIENDFRKTIAKTFSLPDEDKYVYKTEGFSMTLFQVEKMMALPQYKYRYKANGEILQIPDSDISAYTAIFSSTTDSANFLKSFAANAKKGSPRETVAQHLLARRILPVSIKVPKLKKHINPYYDIWSWSCREIGFLGPLNEPAYSVPAAAKQTHPMMPVLYHHFGCVCPSYEALYIISQLATSENRDGVLEMASGNGYWTYMLRRIGSKVDAVDNMEATWRYMWINDTMKANGVTHLQKSSGAKTKVLLMVYMVTKGNFTKQVLKAYKGDIIVIAGTQNENRFTGFADVTTEEYFEREMKDFESFIRIPLPSFAGKDEALYVYQRKK